VKLSKALEGYFLTIASDGYSPVTVKNYRWFLSHFMREVGDKELPAITTDDLRRFLNAYRDSGRAGASVAMYWCAIRSFYNFAEKELNAPRPDLAIKQPRYLSNQKQPFTRDEVKKLLTGCRSARNKALVLFLLDTGVRASECARLTVNDVDLNTGAVQVIPYLSGAKSRGRIVYISRATRSILWKYIETRANTFGLFTTVKGSALDRNDIANILNRLGNKCGIPRVRPHRFRHTFAIEYLRNGGDVFTLKTLLGHSSLDMVKRYLAIAQVDVESAHRRASPVEKWGL